MKRLFLSLLLFSVFSYAQNELSPVENVPNMFSQLQQETRSMFGGPAADEPLQPDQAFKLSVINTGNNTLKVVWEIEPNYYLYHDKLSIDVQNAKVSSINFPKGKIKNDEFFGKVEVHKNRLEVDVPLQDIQTKDIVLTVQYQGCWEGGVCYPPQEKRLNISLPDTIDAQPKTTNKTTSAIVANAQPELTPTQQIISSIQSGSLYSVLFLFFIAGLGISFTSCVLPMIPILSATIIGQKERVSTKKAFFMSLVFVVFMSLALALVGILFAQSGEQIQIVLQNPWALGSFSLLFILLAFSMFGYFEIKIPNFIQNKLANISNKQKGGSFIGVAIMGFLSALIVGPCSAPVLSAALLYIAQSDTNNIALGASTLFALGMGMGTPLIVAGTGVAMPKPGIWMYKVKHVFGSIMLGMAIYFMQRVLPEDISLILWALLFTITPIALGVLNTQTNESTPWQRIFRAIGLIILAYGVLLFGLVARGGGDMLAPLAGYGGTSTQIEKASVRFQNIKSISELDDALASAKSKQQIVMLDFYADWCSACKELEHFVFSNERVVAAMQNVIALQADVTANNANDKALMKRFNIIGPPGILFFNNGVEKPAQRIVGEISASDFLAHLQKVQ